MDMGTNKLISEGLPIDLAQVATSVTYLGKSFTGGNK